MAKANSPIRLDAELMKAAAQHGQLHHRSAAETVEYWASIGKRLVEVIGPDQLLKIQAGALQVVLKQSATEAVDSEQLFADMESQRQAGTLNHFIQRQHPVYQACKSQPGMLEQVLPDGTVNIGRFQNGEFHLAQNG